MAAKKAEKEKTKSKDELLASVIKDIEKEYGKGSIMKLGDRTGVDVEPIPSGSLLLDKALGIGGYPKGRIIEIYGPESSGKTTLALHAIAEVQKRGGRAAFIDAENAIDPVYAKHLGVNIDELILSQPDSGEQGLNIMLMLIESGAVDLVVVDSVAALVPQVELDGEMGEMQVGAQARMMSKAMRKLSGMMNQNDCTAIFINQLRLKVGVMYGNPETTPGGYALKFYASVRIEIRKSEVVKNGTEIVGNKVNVKIVKNKVAPPFRKCQLEITYGQGLSALSELVDLAVEYDVIKKSGSWYSYQGDKIGQGKEAAKEFLKNNEPMRAEIEGKVQELIRGSNLSDDIDADDLAKAKESDELDLNDEIEAEFGNIDLETGEILDE
ncbi:recombinase RecA [Erysipelotrichaceae bacterium RD49]|nr:recombinase RecA [Erysipelotrichaceae bacterium RD49]